MNDGVFNILENQKPPKEIEGQATCSKIKDLVNIGAKVFYCSQCVETRGITEAQIASVVEKSNLIELAKSSHSIRDLLIACANLSVTCSASPNSILKPIIV